MGGKFHLKLNIGERPIANKYREGKMKRTLKRELNQYLKLLRGNGWTPVLLVVIFAMNLPTWCIELVTLVVSCRSRFVVLWWLACQNRFDVWEKACRKVGCFGTCYSLCVLPCIGPRFHVAPAGLKRCSVRVYSAWITMLCCVVYVYLSVCFHMQHRDSDEMVFIHPSWNTDQGV